MDSLNDWEITGINQLPRSEDVHLDCPNCTDEVKRQS